jgi:cytidyltransferase-like protein
VGERGVFPGTFDPLTVGHLAVADAAHAELGLVAVELVISHDPLAKRATTPVEDRIAAIAAQRADRPWLSARATAARLLADIAEGYDVLILGADKWHQLHDVGFYGSVAARDGALARLPRVAVAPRAGIGLPGGGDVHVLSVPAEAHEVSSTAVRSGREDWRA